MRLSGSRFNRWWLVVWNWLVSRTSYLVVWWWLAAWNWLVSRTSYLVVWWWLAAWNWPAGLTR
ncbi:hypothetical protein CJ186_01240 [Actinomyces graevenitzii]|nr:hypothetical protein CJ186_01240 [Actinomyces graevenitzii]